MYDVVIIGAGVTGAAIARELSKFKLSVALVEKQPDVAMGATKANSAIVHGGYAEAHDKLKGRLCYQGRREFAALDGQLHFGFKAIGSLVLAFEEAQKAALVQLMDNGRLNGLKDLELLDGRQVQALEPHVNPGVRWGLYCKGAGVCSSFELAVALAENAADNGVEVLLNRPVQRMASTPEGFLVTTPQGVLATRFVVNAAGLQAAEVAAMAGEAGFTIHPRSGEYIIMAKGTGKLVNTALFQMPTKMGKGVLVTPTVYGNLMIGPDAIDEERDDRNTHTSRLYEIYTAALKTTPGLDISGFLRSFAGVRPVSSTNDFIIGEAGVKGLINAAGIQSPGLTSSPAVAAMVRDALANGGLELRFNPEFCPERRPIHRGHPPLEAAPLQQQLQLPEGTAGRMLCRCEQVVESVLLEALARKVPPSTVDGVKRRTRAGMGWCQGAFCRPRSLHSAEVLAGRQLDGQTDVERDGLSRVGKEEFLAYAKAMGNRP